MTTVFLDVDGVINAILPPKPYRGDGWKWENVEVGIWVRTSRQLAQWFAAFDADIVWATSWVFVPENLRRLADHLELPHHQMIATDVWDDEDGCGKQPGIARWITEHDVTRPALWIDDEINRHDVLWANQNHIIPIAPDPGRGLSDPDFRDKIRAALSLGCRACNPTAGKHPPTIPPTI